MNTTIIVDSGNEFLKDKPGAQLALLRTEKGYSSDYIAEKLNLRVQLIELLEIDDYVKMPEPVFIKGYLRAYAKLLDIAPEPFIASFNQYHLGERKSHPALWQSRRQTNKAEHTIRWVTGGFGLVVFMAVIIWWHNNKEHELVIPTTTVSQLEPMPTPADADIRLTDLSKMRSLLSSVGQTTAMETTRE